jgi:hypothetical protein
MVAAVLGCWCLAAQAHADLYWSSYGEPSVSRVSDDGAETTPNFIPGGNSVYGVAVDGGHVYWTTLKEGVFRANLDGTGEQQIFSGPGYYYVLAADVDHPSLTNAAGPGTAVGDGTITTTATLAGATGPSGPTGTLTFRLYGPDDESCTGAPVYTDAVNVNGNGTYGPTPFAPTRAGTYRWTVAYAGDYQPLATACGSAGAAVKVTAPAATVKPVVNGSCVAVTASAGTFVPIKKPGKVVPGVRAKVEVSLPSQVTVDPTLTYKSKDGKSRSVALSPLSFHSGGIRKLRMALPAKLRSLLPVGTKVGLALRIAAVPDASPQCTSPSVSTKKLKPKVVRVLVEGQSGVS